MSGATILPHGGTLVSRWATGKSKEEWLQAIPTLKKIKLNRREVSDLEMIGVGAFSPLEGFMGSDDYASVRDRMRLASGIPWPIPVNLAVGEEKADTLHPGDDVALMEGDDRALGILHLAEKYTCDKKKEAAEVYGTTEDAHPGVKAVYQQGSCYLGGKITLLDRPREVLFKENRLDPAQSRVLFVERGWKRVVAFQTRNPVHRAHEYIQKCALEIVDGLLLHPLVGETKRDDIPAHVRMNCYKVLLEKYYPSDRVVLSVLPANMRYAGPREAIFHAIIRKNYGCTHFIVGRDHAGVGNYYGTYDAHYIFDNFLAEEIGITPLFFDHTFYCKVCGGMASAKSCPHDQSEHVFLSGTKVRQMLKEGNRPPVEFTRPEVADILIAAMREG